MDYAITKDQNVIPPKYTVFFKAKDADALTSAFEEFTNRKLKAKEKPSVLEQLNKLKDWWLQFCRIRFVTKVRSVIYE